MNTHVVSDPIDESLRLDVVGESSLAFFSFLLVIVTLLSFQGFVLKNVHGSNMLSKYATIACCFQLWSSLCAVVYSNNSSIGDASIARNHLNHFGVLLKFVSHCFIHRTCTYVCFHRYYVTAHIDHCLCGLKFVYSFAMNALCLVLSLAVLVLEMFAPDHAEDVLQKFDVFTTVYQLAALASNFHAFRRDEIILDQIVPDHSKQEMVRVFWVCIAANLFAVALLVPGLFVRVQGLEILRDAATGVSLMVLSLGTAFIGKTNFLKAMAIPDDSDNKVHDPEGKAVLIGSEGRGPGTNEIPEDSDSDSDSESEILVADCQYTNTVNTLPTTDDVLIA